MPDVSTIATGAPFVSMVHFSTDSFRYTSGQPKFYKSSEIAERGFCSECGTSIAYRLVLELYEPICILTATLDHPNAFPPESHSGVESKIHWLSLADELPRTAYVDDFIKRWSTGEDIEQLYRSV